MWSLREPSSERTAGGHVRRGPSALPLALHESLPGP